MDAILAGVQLAKTQARREEDLRQRAYENEYRAIEDARRKQDMKGEQLKAISNLAALIAGFGMIVLVESNFPDDLSAISVGLNLLSLMVTSLMLVAVLNFDCNQSVRPGELTFQEFWDSRCQKDWLFALRAFLYAMPLFLVDVSLVAWVEFKDMPSSAVLVTVVAGVVMLVLLCYAFPAWAGASITRTQTLRPISDGLHPHHRDHADLNDDRRNQDREEARAASAAALSVSL